MQKCLELLKQAMGSSQSIPYLGLESGGIVAWASPAVQAVFPQIQPEKPLAQLLPECFPEGFPKTWSGEEQEFPLPSGGHLTLTRLSDSDEDCFLGRYYPVSSRPAEIEHSSVGLLAGQIREQVSEANLRLLKAEDDIISIQENYEHIEFFPLQDMQMLQEQIDGVKRISRTMLSFAMQMEEYCRPREKESLILSRLISYDFFSELFHNVTLYMMERGLKFDAKVHPNAKAWSIQLDYRRFTAALLALFRVSYCVKSGCGDKEPALSVSAEIEHSVLLIRIHDAAVDYRTLTGEQQEGTPPDPAFVASRNLRRLVELQNGQWLLSGLPGETGYYLQIRLPARKNDEDPDSRLASPDEYFSSLPLSSVQQELIYTMLADVGCENS